METPEATPDYPPLEFYENEGFRQWLAEHYPSIDESYWWSGGGREALKQLFIYWGNTTGGETTPPAETPASYAPSWKQHGTFMEQYSPGSEALPYVSRPTPPQDMSGMGDWQQERGDWWESQRDRIARRPGTTVYRYTGDVPGGADWRERFRRIRDGWRDGEQPPRPGQPTYPPDTTDRPEGRPYGWRRPRETWW